LIVHQILPGMKTLSRQLDMLIHPISSTYLHPENIIDTNHFKTLWITWDLCTKYWLTGL